MAVGTGVRSRNLRGTHVLFYVLHTALYVRVRLFCNQCRGLFVDRTHLRSPPPPPRLPPPALLTSPPTLSPPHPPLYCRAFYEELPDLLNTVPPNLLGLTEEQAEQLREEERKKLRERNAADHQEADASGGDGGEGGEEGAAGGGEGEEDVLVEELGRLSMVEEGEEGVGDGDGGSDDEVRGLVSLFFVCLFFQDFCFFHLLRLFVCSWYFFSWFSFFSLYVSICRRIRRQQI